MATVADLYDIPEVFLQLADLGLDLKSRISAKKYAIYHTANISQNEVTAAVAAINKPLPSCAVEDDDNDLDAHARLAPHADFTGKHLRDVFEHHKDATVAGIDELADYDALSIIIITDTDWRTNSVLLVSLHNNQASGRGYVFAFPHPAKEAAMVMVIIDVENNSWEETYDSAGADIPEPPAFKKVFEPSAVDRWNVDELGLVA